MKQTTTPVAIGNTTTISTMVSMDVAGPDLVGSGSVDLEWSSDPM